MNGGASQAAVHWITEGRTRLIDFTFTFHTLEKERAIHSSVLAWRIPGTGEPGGLPSMGLHRVGRDWSDLAAVLIVNKSSKCSTWVQSQKKKKRKKENLSSFPRQTVQYYSYLKSMPQPLMPKKLKLNSSMKQNCCSSRTTPSRTNTKKRCPFHHRGLEYKVGSQETPRITGKFCLGVQKQGKG